MISVVDFLAWAWEARDLAVGRRVQRQQIQRR